MILKVYFYEKCTSSKIIDSRKSNQICEKRCKLNLHVIETGIKLAQTECNKKSLQSKNAKQEGLVQNTERQHNRIPITISTGKWGAQFFVFFE